MKIKLFILISFISVSVLSIAKSDSRRTFNSNKYVTYNSTFHNGMNGFVVEKLGGEYYGQNVYRGNWNVTGVDMKSDTIFIGDTLTLDRFLKHKEGWYDTTKTPTPKSVEFWYQNYSYYPNPYYAKFLGWNDIDNPDNFVVTEEMIEFFQYSETNYGYCYLILFTFNGVLVDYRDPASGIMAFSIKAVNRRRYDNETTSINEIKTNSVNYTINNNTIYFENTVNIFSLYNIQGNLISQYKNVNEVVLPLEKGVYIIKTDNESFKIVI